MKFDLIGSSSNRAFKNPVQEYLVRVFVDIDRVPAEVVTSYRTSKVSKYWRDDV